jgi:hypothetical protein
MKYDRGSCGHSGRTTCVASWWLIPVSTSTATISTSTVASTTLRDSITTLLRSPFTSHSQDSCALSRHCTLFLESMLLVCIPRLVGSLIFHSGSVVLIFTQRRFEGACTSAKPSSVLSAGVKGGIAGGVVAGAFAILGIILWLLRRRMSKSRSERTAADEERFLRLW